MAIPHFQVTPQSRKKGASAIAKAAYNAGACLHELDGRLHAYNRKGGIRHRALVFSPDWQEQPETREQFWQAVELSEKRKDACVSREFQGALPRELTYEQNLALAQEWTDLIIERYGLKAADLSIHYPTQYRRKTYAKKDQENPHFHLLIPDRNAAGEKLRIFCHNPQEIIDLRQLWETHVNRHLAAAGETAKISMKTSKAQIATLEEEIAALRHKEQQLIKELEEFEVRADGDDTGRPGELYPGNKANPAREISDGYIAGKQQTPDGGSEPEAAAASPESGLSSGNEGNRRGSRPAGSATGQGTIPNAGGNGGFHRGAVGSPRVAGKVARKRHESLTDLGRRIASRLDGLRYKRQQWLNNHKLSALALHLASRIDGIRYERQQRYRNYQTETQDAARISSQTGKPS